jgi:hypothetical protein
MKDEMRSLSIGHRKALETALNLSDRVVKFKKIMKMS